MKTKEIYEYQIGDHFVYALEYSDFSGLNDEEEAQLDRFCQNKEGMTFHSSEETDEFARCDISGLRGNVTFCSFIEWED